MARYATRWGVETPHEKVGAGCHSTTLLDLMVGEPVAYATGSSELKAAGTVSCGFPTPRSPRSRDELAGADRVAQGWEITMAKNSEKRIVTERDLKSGRTVYFIEKKNGAFATITTYFIFFGIISVILAIIPFGFFFIPLFILNFLYKIFIGKARWARIHTQGFASEDDAMAAISSSDTPKVVRVI